MVRAVTVNAAVLLVAGGLAVFSVGCPDLTPGGRLFLVLMALAAGTALAVTLSTWACAGYGPRLTG